MTTKDYCLSLKGKHGLSFSNSSNGQYSNLNLNQFNQHSNIFSVNHVTASTIISKKDYSTFGERNNCRGNNILWKKSNFGTTDCLNVGQDFNGKKDQRKDLNTQNDNLEIHIASYESYLKSIGANDSSQNDINPNSADSRKEKSGSVKTWKNVKKSFTTSSSSIQNPFELPRQQSECDDDSDMPEIAKFKASQKLFENYAYDKNDSDIKLNTVIRGKKDTYKVTVLLGSFSQTVFKAQEVKSKENVFIKFFPEHEYYAVKCVKEKEVYEKLAAIHSPHFLHLIDYGKRGSSYFLVLPVLDSSVEDKLPRIRKEKRGSLWTRDATQLSNFTKVILAKQMLQCLEHLHSVGVVHGDLSWDNFGILNMETVILFDFEKSEYVDQDKSITTAPTPAFDDNICPKICYAPLATYRSQKFHFKEDVESLCYVLCELFTALPWTDNYKIAIEKEKAFQEGSDFLTKIPFSLRAMHHHARQLDYNERPNYEMLSSMIDGFFKPKDMIPILDWNKDFIYRGMLMPPHIKKSTEYIINADDYDPLLVAQLEALTCKTANSTFYDTDFSDCSTAKSGEK